MSDTPHGPRHDDGGAPATGHDAPSGPAFPGPPPAPGAPPPDGAGAYPPEGVPGEPRDAGGAAAASAGEPGEEDAAPAVPPAEPERALSPLTLVTAPVNYLKSFIVPLIAAIVAGSFNPWVLASAGVAIAAMLIGGFVTWYTFRYQVGSERLEIRRGLISRSRRSIPLERIRGVDVTSHLLHRMLDLAVVRIEAAAGGGGEGEEGKLDAVSVAEAERLRGVLLHRRAVLRGDPAGAVLNASAGAHAATPPAGDTAERAEAPGATAPAETVYFTMPPGWYFYAVLSLGYLLTPFVALATVLGAVGQSLDDLTAGTDAGDAVLLAYEWASTMSAQALTILAAAAVAVLVLLMPLFAVVSYAVSHWGFTLRRRDASLVVERGLFTRRSVTLEHRRIRGHEFLDNPLERVRRVVRLRAIVTGLGDSTTRAVLLPIGPRSRVRQVVEQALTPFRGSLTPHPRAALGRRLFRAVVPFAVAAGAAAYAGVLWLAVPLGAAALLGVPLAYDRYRALGHGHDGAQVSVRSGSLRRVQPVVHRSAVIGWTWTQTLFQRRAGLVHAKFAVGAGEGGYTAVDADFAESVAFAAGVTPAMVRPFLVTEPGPAAAPSPDPA
ncbi:PH domain-containing protein [Nocardiopsis mangrovi]|uniref:PH domain-containing protein n=1 Tax=Nocardiopsis mangrovi TaxID=1179818 RepID=A0ABV9E0V2_9ACTN